MFHSIAANNTMIQDKMRCCMYGVKLKVEELFMVKKALVFTCYIYGLKI